MPSCMIHLHTARLLQAQGCGLFFIGAIAPDALEDWRQKDRTHLRSVPDRAAALVRMAEQTDPRDAFHEGVLLHLYTDWRWDITQLQRYLAPLGEAARGSSWVPGYRREIALASAWVYHHCSWGHAIWQDMLAVPEAHYGGLEMITPGEVRYYLLQNFHWLERNAGPSSGFYPPETVEAFAEATAEEYRAWRAGTSIGVRQDTEFLQQTKSRRQPREKSSNI